MFRADTKPLPQRHTAACSWQLLPRSFRIPFPPRVAKVQACPPPEAAPHRLFAVAFGVQGWGGERITSPLFYLLPALGPRRARIPIREASRDTRNSPGLSRWHAARCQPKVPAALGAWSLVPQPHLLAPPTVDLGLGGEAAALKKITFFLFV